MFCERFLVAAFSSIEIASSSRPRLLVDGKEVAVAKGSTGALRPGGLDSSSPGEHKSITSCLFGFDIVSQ